MEKTYFLAKSTILSEKVIAQLQKEFSLLNENIEEIKYWNDENSPYGGTIISPEGQFPCYPYDKGKEAFLREYPDGEMWDPR